MRTSVPWQLQDTALQVSRSVSVHGLCATHRSREPTGHRDLLAGDAAPSCIDAGLRYPVSRSTLADANENRDWRIYADFVSGAHWPRPQALQPRRLRSTTLKIRLMYVLRFQQPSIWVFHCFRGPRIPSAQSRLIKPHNVDGSTRQYPSVLFALQRGRFRDDVGLLDELILEPIGAFYILDRGYIRLCAAVYPQGSRPRSLSSAPNAILRLYSAVCLRHGRQKHRLAQRPDHRTTTRPEDLTRLPRCPAPHQLRRPRDGEAVRISHQTISSFPP